MQRRTREAQEAVLIAVEHGQSRAGAAAAAGIARSTFYTWVESSEKFRDELLAAEGKFERAMTARIVMAAAAGSPRWAAWMLLHRARMFGWAPPTQSLELSGGLELTGTAAMVARLERLDDDEIEEELARLRSSKARQARRGLPPRPEDLAEEGEE